ncbi:relaxase/mobilization nuclease domain-containing protein [Sphingomonas sp.]|jgi:hypothetical protein|uniref:relaxase/mobilization nuclease domain-containing protein n=1 Tax=Sphingomonas sp. TaxID=28214 RepID=UPI003F714D08
MVIVEKPAKEGERNGSRYARSLACYMETAKRSTLAEEYGLTLSRYMATDREAARDQDAERVLATGGLVGGQVVAWEAALQQLEQRMAKRSSRSKKPARHLIGSVHADEDIIPEACADMAATLAHELGCEAGTVLWALHGDTDNRHIHFLVLTLDEHGATTPFGRGGQSHEAMQRAIARIEHAHGFAREAGARYQVRNGRVERTASMPPRAKKRAPIGPYVLQSEEETGVESFTRYAQELLAPQLERAASWDEAQALLAPLGAQVIKTGSGGQLQTGDGLHHVNLTKVDRALSWAKLTQRWGEWSRPTSEPAPYEPRILDLERARRWVERDAKAESLHAAVQGRIDRLRLERKSLLNDLKADIAAKRAELGGLAGNPSDLAMLRVGLAAMARRRISAIDAEYHDRISALRELRGEIDEVDDLDVFGLNDLAAQDCSLVIDWATCPADRIAPTGFVAVSVGASVQYWRDDLRGNAPAFVERADRIWINDSADDVVRAALIVAQARYGVVAAHGDPAFVAKARRLGRELGIEVQEGAATPVPPARERSPRIKQRRDAVRRSNAAAGHPQALPEVASATAERHASADQANAVPHRASGGSMPEQQRRAILARVARQLAEHDWDPREYHRAAKGGKRQDGERRRDAAEPTRSSSPAHQARAEATGRGR